MMLTYVHEVYERAEHCCVSTDLTRSTSLDYQLRCNDGIVSQMYHHHQQQQQQQHVHIDVNHNNVCFSRRLVEFFLSTS